MPLLRLDLDYASPLWTDRRALGRILRQAAKTVFFKQHVATSELPHPDCKTIVIAVRLTDDSEMHALNVRFRHQDKPTNVLSFPSSDEEAMAAQSFLGNIAIGYETAAREAEQDGKSLTDHVVHLLVHGCLHLIGYDHEQESEAEEMEQLEIAILEALGIANPYAQFELVPHVKQDT
jgi:probable rRNA maturation factor